MDDKPIPGVDALWNALPAVRTHAFLASIALNLWAYLTTNQQKYEQANNADPNQALNNFMLLVNSFKKSTAILAQTLLIQNPTELSFTHTSKTFLPITTFFLDDRISRIKFCLTKIQNNMSFWLIKI